MTVLTSVELEGWDTNLLVHARVADLTAVAALSRSDHVGAVFTTADHSTASAVVRQMQAAGSDTPVLLDADRYSGRKRIFASGSKLSAAWLRQQHSLGNWALTDSGFIAAGDVRGLQMTLMAAKGAGSGIIAALPLAAGWLDEDLDILSNEIGETGVPIALMLEHRDDPFSARKTVRGVIRLLENAESPILILRCDVSVLGALAYGAVAAAVGTRSSLRHIYPIVTQSGGAGRPAQISALFEPTLSYRSMDKLTDAIAVDPDDPLWRCYCDRCYGRSVEWILNSRYQETESFRHSISCLRRLADLVTSANRTADERRRSWREMCQHAQAISWGIADANGKAWQPPKALAAWNSAVPITAGY